MMLLMMMTCCSLLRYIDVDDDDDDICVDVVFTLLDSFLFGCCTPRWVSYGLLDQFRFVMCHTHVSDSRSVLDVRSDVTVRCWWRVVDSRWPIVIVVVVDILIFWWCWWWCYSDDDVVTIVYTDIRLMSMLIFDDDIDDGIVIRCYYYIPIWCYSFVRFARLICYALHTFVVGCSFVDSFCRCSLLLWSFVPVRCWWWSTVVDLRSGGDSDSFDRCSSAAHPFFFFFFFFFLIRVDVWYIRVVPVLVRWWWSSLIVTFIPICSCHFCSFLEGIHSFVMGRCSVCPHSVVRVGMFWCWCWWHCWW